MGSTLPPAARIAIGIVMLLLGLALGAFGAWRLLSPAEPLAFLALPAGLAFVFAGALILVPPERKRLQLLFGALMVTSLAFLFDWVAFGPGERRFSASAGMGGVSVSSSHVTELAGRGFFGLFAVLMDIAAIGLWIKLIRGDRSV